MEMMHYIKIENTANHCKTIINTKNLQNTSVTHVRDYAVSGAGGHARAAPYFFTFHTIISTMGSKEARNSRKALLS